MSFFRRKKLPSAIKPSVTFGRLLYQRLDHDGLTMLAGHLAYVSAVAGAAGHRRPVRRFPDVFRHQRAAEELYFSTSCRPPAT